MLSYALQSYQNILETENRNSNASLLIILNESTLVDIFARYMLFFLLSRANFYSHLHKSEIQTD